MRWLKKTLRKGTRRRVYLDYAAATPLDEKALQAMEPYERGTFGNPSSVHREGVTARKELEAARKSIARTLRARPEEIIFTSGGTESNNLAIFGVIEAAYREGRSYQDMHAITSVVEHASVLESIRKFETRGGSVTYVEVDGEGRIHPQAVFKVLRPATILVSLMYVNNEIGVVTSLRTIFSRLRALKAVRGNPDTPLYCHTDVSQAPLFFDCAPERLGADLMTIDASKLYGPKGVGLFFRKHNVPLAPIFSGGEQEWGLRPGTEALPLIAGFEEALSIAGEARRKETNRISRLRDLFENSLVGAIEGAEINGARAERAPHITNVSFSDVDAEYLVIQLDQAGIAASAASACRAGRGEVSHVVSALKQETRQARGAVRFSFGRDTKERDVREAASILTRCVEAQRALRKNF